LFKKSGGGGAGGQEAIEGDLPAQLPGPLFPQVRPVPGSAKYSQGESVALEIFLLIIAKRISKQKLKYA